MQGDFILHVAIHRVPTGSEGYTKARKSLSMSHTLSWRTTIYKLQN